MRRRGQSTTEYMIGISVLSIALAAVILTYIEVISDGTLTVSNHLQTSLSDASHGGDGVQ